MTRIIKNAEFTEYSITPRGIEVGGRIKESFEDLKSMRCLRDWSNTQIIEELAKEKRREDIEVFHKFINSPKGFDALQGGNVQLLGEPLTEFVRVYRVLLEFGRLAPEVHYLTIQQWEDIKLWK